MKVQAKEMVYYAHKRRREGDVFVLEDPKHYSERSMLKLDEDQESSKDFSDKPISKKNRKE